MNNLLSRIPKVSPVKRMLMQPIRNFNRSVKPPQVSNYGGYLLMGGALSGMAYLTYSSMAMSKNK
jgi:hypothetical protein